MIRLTCLLSLQMSNITVTYRDGRVAQLEQVYIRGSKIRFLILPDMLKNAPMLKSMKNKNQGSGAGRGKAAILKAQGKGPGPHSVLLCPVEHWLSRFRSDILEFLSLHESVNTRGVNVSVLVTLTLKCLERIETFWRV